MIYLCRHGQTDSNRQAILLGQTDAPLNEAGRMEAAKAAEFFQNKQFHRVYSSCLSRAVETAKIIVGDNVENVEIVQDAKLNEIFYGKWDGIRQCTDTREAIPAPGGETLEDLAERVQLFLDDLTQNVSATEDILIVSHATTIRMMIALIRNIPLSTFFDQTQSPPNCGGYLIRKTEVGFEVVG